MSIPYRLIRSSRRTIAVQILPDGEVVVRAPRRMTRAAIDRFVEEKRGWIEKHLHALPPAQQPLSGAELRGLVQQAKEELPKTVAHFAPLVGVDYGTITIRAQRTRWGSCSSRGNLNFNCLLMLAPENVREYVVVHELCHRKEMNHSPGFWAEVARVLPDYGTSRRWLRENGGELIGRLPK